MTKNEPDPLNPDTLAKTVTGASEPAIPDTILGSFGGKHASIEDASSLFLSPQHKTSGTSPLPVSPPGQVGGQIGEYQLLNEIARGGMGIVFKARHRKLNRIVALKVTRADQQAPEEECFRFLAEAEAAAKLDHPNIVPIYEVGEEGGRLFFSMAFIEGKSLAQMIRSGPLAPRKAAELTKLVAEAVFYAHSRGVIHRDLKPANILVDALGLPRITDFGVAKRMDDESGMTKAGQIMGTPSYMSPEQAGGKNEEVGPLSDVYSLGATLYCLLTGRPPFQAAGVIDTLRQVEDREPVPPRYLNPAVDRDLDTVCLKCLEKRPDRRYQSAKELAADLGRFLDGQTIQARPIGPLGRFARWCRRNPRDAALTATVSLLLVSITVASLLAVQHIKGINKDLIEARNTADTNAENEKVERRRADDQAAETRRQLERLYSERGLDLAKDNDLFSALLWWTQPFTEEHGHCEREDAVLKRLSLFWRYAQTCALQHIFVSDDRVHSVVFSSNGLLLATGSEDGTARIWEVKTGQPVGPPLMHSAPVYHVAFSPDGHLLASSSWGDGMKMWEAATGRLLFHLVPGRYIAISAFSPDGKSFIFGGAGKDVCIRSIGDGQPISPPLMHQRELNCVSFSPDGSKVLTASWDGTARVWDAKSGLAISPPLPHTPAGVTWASFSPNGRQVVTAGWDHNSRVWESETGKPVSSMQRHRSQLRQATFSPDGRFVVTASEDGTARVSEVASGRAVSPPLQHQSVVWRAVFSPDGRLVATASRDGTARLWDPVSGQSVGPLFRHQRAVRDLAFSPDGKLLAIASEDGTVRLWQITRPATRIPFFAHKAEVQDADFSQNGQLLVTVSNDKSARLWDVATETPFTGPLQHDGIVKSVAFSHDQKKLITASDDHTARIWDIQTGKAIGKPLQHSQPVRHASFSPDSRLVVTASLDETAKVWDVATGKPILTFKDQGGIWHAEFGPDGRLIATAGNDGSVSVCELATGQRIVISPKYNRIVSWVTFSPDGLYLLSASEDGNAQVCEATTGKPVSPVLKHGAAVHQATFSPDGRWVLTASQDGTAQVWESITGRPVSPPLLHQGPVFRANFSKDGRWVVTASGDATARIWDAASGQAVSPPLMHKGSVLSARFSPDGKKVVTASSDGKARLWEVTTDGRTAAEWFRLGELLCGHRLSRQGALIPVSQIEMESALINFRKTDPRDFGGEIPK